MSEKKRDERKYMQFGIKWCLVILISILLSVVVAGSYGKTFEEYAKDVIFGSGRTFSAQSYDPSDVEYVNYQEQDGYMVSVNEDPQLIISGVQGYVKNVVLELSLPMKENTGVFIYYDTDGKGFSPQNVINGSAGKGETRVEVPLFRAAKALRVDVGDSAGVSVSLERILLNDQTSKIGAAGLRKALAENIGKMLWWDRFRIFLILFIFLGIHFIYERKKLYHALFQWRWLIGALLLVFLVANRYNGNSLEMYDNYIQKGQGNEYIQTVLGRPRAIRSDEWLVDSAFTLNYYNTTGLWDGFSVTGIIKNPFALFVYLLRAGLGAEYAYSYSWYYHIILSFLIGIEFFMILTDRQKFLSVTGACMICLSSFYLWWGFPGYFMNAEGALVCFYYFFRKEKIYQKIACLYGILVFGLGFISTLYPAWQVPMGYLVLLVIGWIIWESREQIKAMKKKDWMLVAAAAAAGILAVGIFVYQSLGYIESITSTVYPGKRVFNGGFCIIKAFDYIPGMISSFKNISNNSENSAMISMFPLPLFLWGYYQLKYKKRDILLNCLGIFSLVLTVYCCIKIPVILAKVTLFSYVSSERAVDILGYIQVIMFVRGMHLYAAELSRDERTWNSPRLFMLSFTRRQMILAAASVLISLFSVWCARKAVPLYLGKAVSVLFFGFFSVVFYLLLMSITKKRYELSLAVMVGISLLTGIFVRPVSKGFDAVTSKPAASAIEKINTEDPGKWLCPNGLILQSYSAMFGADTVNLVNKTPNMELYHLLDPEGKYEEVYNRYAHVIVKLTEKETYFKLTNPDVMELYLSYQDLKKTDAKYLFSTEELDYGQSYFTLESVYNEYGAHIYKIRYK